MPLDQDYGDGGSEELEGIDETHTVVDSLERNAALTRSATAPPAAPTAHSSTPPTPPDLSFTELSLPPIVNDHTTASAESSVQSSSSTSPESRASSAPSSALRRTLSSLSGDSSSRERKRLRFTRISEKATLSRSGSPEDSNEDVLYPGGSSSSTSHTTSTKSRGVPKDQAQYLTSEPATPNFSET